MPQASRPVQQVLGRISNNRDIHQVLAWVVTVLGPMSAVSLFWAGAHMFSTVTGLVAVAVGSVSQLIADNRSEEWESVIGLVAGAVGLFVGAANGGFS